MGRPALGGFFLKAACDYFKRYKKSGLDGLLRMIYIGSEALLDDTQLLELDDHLQSRLYLTAEAIARHVQKRWEGVTLDFGHFFSGRRGLDHKFAQGRPM